MHRPVGKVGATLGGAGGAWKPGRWRASSVASLRSPGLFPALHTSSACKQEDTGPSAPAARVTAVPSRQLAELQCEVAALREEQKAMSGLLESLRTQLRAMEEQQVQLGGRLQDLDSRLGER